MDLILIFIFSLWASSWSLILGVSITEFGGVGDGVTSNTVAFKSAIEYLSKQSDRVLTIPEGNWLTGCFNLTSGLTLFLDTNATILASQELDEWPVIDPLPSYGRGRERPGRRYSSLIHAENVSNITITGNNGTINGQGSRWWNLFKKHRLQYSRGMLLEFINCTNILIENVTLENSPSWTVHPVYSNNVTIQGVTILAPFSSPNTDGINPDSSSNVSIRDCYISNGDDAIAIKSGWDEYGIAFGRPSTNIVIQNITVHGSHGISLGSEMSGGISNVRVEGVTIYNAKQGIHIKTAQGRGAYITNVYFSNMKLFGVRYAFSFSAMYGQHPDNGYDPNAYTKTNRIMIKDVVGQNVSRAGKFLGLPESPFNDVCFVNISLDQGARWTCNEIQGFSQNVTPEPCAELQSLKNESSCTFIYPPILS